MVVTSAPQSANKPATQQSATGAARITGDYQMFLKMLTAQMRNQDPLNPVESSDYAVQLATFSGVEQQVRTNELLAALTGQLGVTGMGQLAAWVGMEARAAAPVAFAGQPVTLHPAPAANADRTVLVAYDAQGKEVTRQDIPVSADPVRWTGQTQTGGSVLHGTYSFRLESYAGETLISSEKVEAFGRVTEIRQGNNGPLLVLEGGATVLPGDVRALRPATGG
jgi:flagellar basal-body rod modification protein FlgD